MTWQDILYEKIKDDDSYNTLTEMQGFFCTLF